MILETNRLLLRELTMEDIDEFLAIFSDPDVMKYSFREVKSRDWVMGAIEHLRNYQMERGYSMWATILKEDGRLIGHCGIHDANVEGIEEIELGYIFARDYWGRGLATEVALAIRDYRFNELGLRRLISLIDPANTSSQRVAEKIGMRHERDTEYPKGIIAQVYAIER